jgi:parallel beta-helix repeat protein
MKIRNGIEKLGMVLALVAFMLVLMPSVHAVTTECVNCADCNEKIQTASYGDVVTLTADINDHDGTCINFNGKDSITFDGDNHTIDGAWNCNGYGIYLSGNSNDNIIKNCEISDFRRGIYMHSCSNTTIQDSMLQENKYYDFYFSANAPAHCDTHLINVTGSGNRPIGFYNQSVTLHDLEFSSLYLCNADNSVLNNITIEGSDTYPNNGLHMFYTDNSILTSITSSRNYDGIYLSNAVSNKLLNIIANDNGNNGIVVREYSDGNTLENIETYSNSDYGIYLTHSSSNKLTDILSDSNSDDGVYIGYSSSTTINNSYILNNGRYGINLDHAGSTGANLIYNNRFCNDENVNFTAPVYANDWNTTKTSGTNIIGGLHIGGNYWATPDENGFSETCIDGNGDGICDESYILTAGNIDHLPLAKPEVSPNTIYVNKSGWWINPDQFNVSSTPIQSAVNNATAGDTIIVHDWNYTENVCVPKRLTIRSDNGSANCIVTAASAGDHVFDVTADYVNISGFTVTMGTPGGWMAGVYLNTADHCNISNNIISKDYNGIQLLYSDNNTLTGNNVSSNFNFGIQLSSSSNNLIYDNYFNNSRNVRSGIEHKNYWNITNTTRPNIVGGPFTGGNYWSDYLGTDTNDDGFGDTPYNVNGTGDLNIDYLPLFDFELPDIRIDPTTLNFKTAPADGGKDGKRGDYMQPPRSKPDKPIDMIIVDGRPPEIIRAPAVSLPEPHIAEGINVLQNVPAFDWSYGCSATAAAMMMGYYDNNGYPNMYTGPANGGVCPLTNSVWGSGECPLSATHQGIDGRTGRGHVDDYWNSYGSGGPDPYVANSWAQQTWGNCTADFMGTSQDKFVYCTDGATTFCYYTNGYPVYDFYIGTGWQDGCYGMRRFVESRGYIVLENFNQYIYGYNENTNGSTFENYTAEIDAGRPVIIQVTEHSMLGFGYDNSTGQQIIKIHDTWDHANHNLTWGGNYEGLTHYGVTVMRLAPVDCPTQSGVFSIIEDAGRTLAINAISKNESWITLDHPDTSFSMVGYGQRAVIVRVNGSEVVGGDSDVISISSNDPDESPVGARVNVLGMCGDVDGNGLVNILDVRLLMNHVADSTGYPVESWAGNVDGIGGIDNADVQLLLGYVFAPEANPLNCDGV